MPKIVVRIQDHVRDEFLVASYQYWETRINNGPITESTVAIISPTFDVPQIIESTRTILADHNFLSDGNSSH